jgi:hypothetical protein
VCGIMTAPGTVSKRERFCLCCAEAYRASVVPARGRSRLSKMRLARFAFLPLPRLYRFLTLGAQAKCTGAPEEHKGHDLFMNHPLRISGALAIALTLLTVSFETRLALRPSAKTTILTTITAPPTPTGTTTATTTTITAPTGSSTTTAETHTPAPVPTTTTVGGG